MTIQGYDPQDLVDLYMVARNVEFRYKLDLYEEEVLRGVLATLNKSVDEVKRQLGKYFVSQTADERGQAILAELDRLTLGIRQTLAEQVLDASSEAGYYSTLEHNDILSFGAKVTPFNTVALSPEQFRAFFATVPLGGKLLTEWVDASFDSTVRAGMIEELQAGVLQGEGYPALVKRLTSDFELTKREAVTIARTFVQSANVEAQEAVYAANADIVPMVRWTAVLENGYKSTGRGTCIRCACLDSRTFPREGPKPPMPLHPRCVVGDTLISAPGTIAAIRTEYSGPVIDLRIDNGRTLTVTKNHRIMTARGPLPACEIKKGDKVLFDVAHDELSKRSEHNYGLPPKASDIFKLFHDRFKLISTEPRPSGVDLHGDARFVNGNIDVVSPESLLRGDFKTLFSDDLPDLFFPGPNVTDADFPRLGENVSMLVGMGLSAQAVSNSLTVFDALTVGHGGESDERRFGVVPDVSVTHDDMPSDNALTDSVMPSNGISRHAGVVHGNDFSNRKIDAQWAVYASAVLDKCGLGFVTKCDALADKGAFDWLSTPPDNSADLFLGLPGTIELRDVEFVGERSFNGHVYDLQTVSSTYYANGILSSNCRCVWLPVTKTWKELGIDLPELENITRPYTKRPDQNIDTGGKRTIIEVGQQQGSYGDWFKDQSKKFKTDAVGPERYDLLKSGKVKWDDLVTDEGRVRTLKELRALK